MVKEEEKPHVQPAAFTYLQQPRNPPNFSGKGSELAHLWLKDYSRVAAHNGWDESMCLANVVFFLEGAARCWFDNVEESITTWNTFKEEFTRTFGDKEDYARRIESSLKVRAQKPDESVELYIQDVLNLCRQLNPNMSEEDRVGHLMKGVAENIYWALLAIEVTTTGEFTQHCRRIEKLNKNRISSVRFERIPTVSAINENEYHPLKEMIREIIREELRSAPNELDNLPPPQGLEDRVWQRVEQNLAHTTKHQCSTPEGRSRMSEVDNKMQGKRHDAILGWDFLESSKAVIDCGHSEISFSETLNEDQSAAQLHLASDDIIPPKCTKRVLTRTPSVTGIKNCAVEGARQLFLEKELFVPSSYLTIWHGQAYLWVTNSSKHPKTIPSGMCLAHLFRVQPQEVCPIMENHSNNKSKSAKSPIRITNFECREENFFKVGSSEQLMRMEQISACIPPELPLLHKTKLLELLENFSEVFGSIDKTTSRIITKHRINTGDAKPSKKMPYRVSPSERKVIQEEVDRMMEMGVVQPSESPWASPVVLVRKKDGSVRFCVDYRGLNKMTKKDVYPLPRVDDALDCLKGANIYSTIDLKAGYWQIGIDEADREKTAFITPDGLFEFKVMPFGLCNAPATFERMMDNLLKGLRWTICLCYLDDVVIFADNFPDHLRRLEVVLNCFKRAGLKLNPGKCSFGASNIKILGHQVDKDGSDQMMIRLRRPYLFGRPFKVITDHHSLCWLTNLKDPAGRLARWALRLQEYDVSIVYKTGRMHKDADCLSRNPIENTEKVFNDDIPTLFLLSDISKEQEKDPYITGIIKEISQPSPAKKDNKFEVVNGILYRKNYDPTGLPLLLVIPRHLRMEILGDLHDAPTAGHLGFAKTYDRIRRRFYWPGMYRSVRRYVGHCQDCQRRKSVPQLPPGYLRPISPPDRPFQKVGIDLLGRFPISQGKKKWIVVCTDYLTKYAVTQSLGSGGAQEIAKFLLEEVILKHGAPREIVMDRGRNFQSRLIQELTKNCHIKKKTTTAYHPQTNGLTERLNRTIADMYMDLDQKNWDEMLSFITFAYNTARQESTGFTPFFLIRIHFAYGLNEVRVFIFLDTFLTTIVESLSVETFDFSTPNEWPKWRKRFERYLVVSGMKKKEEADKIDLFMYLMGDRADDIFRTFKFEKEEEATKIDSVLKAFDSHFCVRKNIIYERAKFNSRIQEDREPVDEFITSLYKLADSCEFEGLHEQLIRDRIVVGVRDKALSERMQLDSELTLEKAVKMVRQQEAIRQQQVDLQRPSASQKVNQVKFNSKNFSPKQQQQPSRKKEKSAKTRSRCPKCGGFTHREGQACRAEGQKCNLCSKTGHFANCCPDKQAKTAEVKAVSELDEEIGFLLEVSAVEDSSNLDDDERECRRRWTAEIQVNGKKVKFKLDSQADVTCVPLCLFKKIMGQQRLVKSDINLRAAEFSELQTVGMFISTLRNGNYEIKEKIYVIRLLSEPLLSRRACELLNLARRIEVVATRINPIKEFPEVFEGLGQIGNPYEIKLKPGAKPYAVHTPRRVPIPLMEKLRTRLEELEKAGIIAQVNVATEWCAPTVIAGKPNGDIRLCVDLSRLNEHVQREVHPMPVVEHMLGQLGEARFFSKLDANSGFHQIPLSPDCQHLTTFITPFGRYKYCRMPFGISLAPEYFQRVMSIILQGMDGVMCYLDDILIFASDSKSHDRILRLVLRKLKEAKVTLNKAKCVFGVPRINFLGHILDEDGIRPDPAKIEAVAKMPAPTDVHGVRRFLVAGERSRLRLGLQPGASIPKVERIAHDSTHLGSIRRQETNYGVIRRIFIRLGSGTEARRIEFADPKTATFPNAYDEVWFRNSAYPWKGAARRRCIIQTTTSYNRGNENERQTLAHINAVLSSITDKDEMLTKIFEAQQEDTTLKAVVNYLEQGWPDKKKMSPALLSYWHVKDELGVQNGLLMRGCRLVIPASMKLEILDKLHAGHFGITKTRLRARETVWWPGISEEIAETVRKCSVCIQEAVSKHEPLIPTNFPTRPWQKIGMDLFKFENKWYLVVIDYYSRFPEMIQLDRLTASVVVRSCKSIFARHGVPETVVSDNGTQFGAAREFANFARQYGFQHVTSSPRFPQSNGMAEAGVKIAKLILKKNQDPSLGLLEYRSTPLENGYSPAELLMGRKLRTTLPIAPENLNPKLVDSQTLKRKEGRRRKDMKSRYDRRCGATDMEELSEGDTVWITDMRTWGIVKQKASTPRSPVQLKHLSSLRREIVFKNKDKTPLPAVLNIPYMDRNFTIFVGEDVVCKGCKRHGHLKNKCPFDPTIRATVTRTFSEAIIQPTSPDLPSETPKEAPEPTKRPSETPSMKRPLTDSSEEENLQKERNDLGKKPKSSSTGQELNTDTNSPQFLTPTTTSPQQDKKLESEEPAPAGMTSPPPRRIRNDTDREEWLLDLFKDLNYTTILSPMLQSTDEDRIICMILYTDACRTILPKMPPEHKTILFNFI
ncbi:K02A2.6-like, partial [Cordylochernes scorpioides]